MDIVRGGYGKVTGNREARFHKHARKAGRHIRTGTAVCYAYLEVSTRCLVPVSAGYVERYRYILRGKVVD